MTTLTATDLATARLRPKRREVLVRLAPRETVSEGGIIIPDTAKQRIVSGVVETAGKGCELEAGDVVLFREFAGHNLAGQAASGLHVETERRVMREREVLAVVEGEPVERCASCGAPTGARP